MFWKREKIIESEGALTAASDAGENDRRGCGKVDGKLPRNFGQSRGGSNPAYKIAFDDSELAMSVCVQGDCSEASALKFVPVVIKWWREI